MIFLNALRNEGVFTVEVEGGLIHMDREIETLKQDVTGPVLVVGENLETRTV